MLVIPVIVAWEPFALLGALALIASSLVAIHQAYYVLYKRPRLSIIDVRAVGYQTNAPDALPSDEQREFGPPRFYPGGTRISLERLALPEETQEGTIRLEVLIENSGRADAGRVMVVGQVETIDTYDEPKRADMWDFVPRHLPRTLKAGETGAAFPVELSVTFTRGTPAVYAYKVRIFVIGDSGRVHSVGGRIRIQAEKVDPFQLSIMPVKSRETARVRFNQALWSLYFRRGWPTKWLANRLSRYDSIDEAFAQRANAIKLHVA